MRQAGRTTQQIIKAPRNAVYVHVSHDLTYLKRIAEVYRRTDLLITGPQWMTQEWRRYQEALMRVGL